jgi:hypothetical protein
VNVHTRKDGRCRERKNRSSNDKLIRTLWNVQEKNTTQMKLRYRLKNSSISCNYYKSHWNFKGKYGLFLSLATIYRGSFSLIHYSPWTGTHIHVMYTSWPREVLQSQLDRISGCWYMAINFRWRTSRLQFLPMSALLSGVRVCNCGNDLLHWYRIKTEFKLLSL